MKLLVIEDDPALCVALRNGLLAAGFAVDVARTLQAAGRLHRVSRHDLIVLDLGMPDGEGLEFLARLRESGSATPVLVLTARGTVTERVHGLNTGADDYLAKPFAFPELIARLRALLRRRKLNARQDEPILQADGLEVDPNRVEVQLDGSPLDLTPFEFRLLLGLMRRPGRVFSRDDLIDAIHGQDDPGIIDRTIDVHLGRLRRKLGDDANHPRFIGTVRTVGYKFLPLVDKVDPSPAAL